MDELSSNWCECTLIYVNPIINNVQTTILVYTDWECSHAGLQCVQLKICYSDIILSVVVFDTMLFQIAKMIGYGVARIAGHFTRTADMIQMFSTCKN